MARKVLNYGPEVAVHMASLERALGPMLRIVQGRSRRLHELLDPFGPEPPSARALGPINGRGHGCHGWAPRVAMCTAAGASESPPVKKRARILDLQTPSRT